MNIPIHFLPWKAKAEIARLRSKIAGAEAVSRLLTDEQGASFKMAQELEIAQKALDAANDRLSKLDRWIRLTHGLNGMSVAKGFSVDVLKRPQIKNEKAINVVLPSSFPFAK